MVDEAPPASKSTRRSENATTERTATLLPRGDLTAQDLIQILRQPDSITFDWRGEVTTLSQEQLSSLWFLVKKGVPLKDEGLLWTLRIMGVDGHFEISGEKYSIVIGIMKDGESTSVTLYSEKRKTKKRLMISDTRFFDAILDKLNPK